jgi:hypothetical protein
MKEIEPYSNQKAKTDVMTKKQAQANTNTE